MFYQMISSLFRLLGHFPNSYAYTKCLSEGLVVEAIEAGLPLMILRPSIGNNTLYFLWLFISAMFVVNASWATKSPTNTALPFSQLPSPINYTPSPH